GKLIDAVDVLIRPAPDGMRFDVARLERIAAAFLAKDRVLVARGAKEAEKGGAKAKDAKQIDVRALVSEVSVVDDVRLTAALDWPDGPMLRVRVRSTSEGSAKPAELAKALGVWGSDDPRAEHALLARLGVVEAAEAVRGPGASPTSVADLHARA
ncbi:MAG TPA: hypothetical protein VLT45_03300, partial [Kofleriaceae bacterium]|nr:hypothetical protein [Kofleriaceae bacterium]